jgi:dipeptidyl aminopeptidase/acylaminoacyl peptidase
VSVAVGTGAQLGDGSSAPSISPDGRYVAFTSLASDAVAGDTNGTSDVFLFDRTTGTTALVSRGPSGTGNASSDEPAAANGGIVAFVSDATDLVSGDGNGASDVFVADTTAATPTITRVSVSASGGDAAGVADRPSLSADGRDVAFTDGASDIVAGDTNDVVDSFVRDRVTGLTQRVSQSAIDGQADDGSDQPVLSGDGRYVAFESGATNLVGGDTNGVADVFTRYVPMPKPVSATPAVARGTTATVTLHGSWFVPGIVAWAGDGVTASITAVGPSTATMTVTVDPGATPGPRDVVVANPATPGMGGGSATCSGCLTVS